MTTNAVIHTGDYNQDWLVGELLGSGNLAEVFTVQKAPEWAVKLIKPGRGEQFIREETNAITFLQGRLDSATRQVLPRIKSATVDGRPALLVERMRAPDFVSLREYVRSLTSLMTDLDWEKRLWSIALQYAQFIADMHAAGYTCNDRKLGDFYYNEKQNRLVVLDWNVIERIDNTNSPDGSRQDIKFLGRAWFTLLGGMDEALYDLDTARLEEYSVAGRAFLWQTLNPTLRERTFSANEPGRDLVRELNDLIALFTKTSSELQRQLDSLLQRQPLNTIQAGSPPELDNALIPSWRLADMLSRRERKAVPELKSIRSLRTTFRKKVDDDIIDSLQVSRLTLDKLERLRSPLSASWDTYVMQWESNIHRLLQGAVHAGINPEPMRDVVTKIQYALRMMISQPHPVNAMPALQTAHELLSSFRLSVSQSPEMLASLTKIARQLELYHLYLEGQQALEAGRPHDALSCFRQASEYANGLPEETMKLLPRSLGDIVNELEQILSADEPRFLRTIRQQLADGKFEAAIYTYEALQASGAPNRVQQNIIATWLQPAYLIQSASTAQQWHQALLMLQLLLPYAKTHSAWEDVVKSYLAAAYKVFKLTAKQTTRSSQLHALELGLVIQHLHNELPSMRA